jgi:hypothetical protein
VVADAPWPDAASRSVAVTSCYDCHSNETKWRWYSNVAPASWLIQRDVDDGRRKLNFSEWPQNAHDLADVVDGGSMPPTKYTLLHPDARLSSAEKARLLAALKTLEATRGGNGRNRGRGGG